MTIAPTLLIVEDDVRLGNFTKMALKAEGHRVHLVSTGSDARTFLEHYPVSLILLDLELPDMQGLELCGEFSKLYDIPIIVFSAEAQVNTKVKALSVGARDYVVKPVDLRELAARVQAQIRLQKKEPEPHAYEEGNLRYDCVSKIFTIDGTVFVLSENLSEILQVLLQSPGKVFSKAELYQRVWKCKYQPLRDSHLVETQISRLRQMLKKRKCQCKIRSRYGKGYFLCS